MKHTSLILVLLIVACLSSCVNRIDIPEDVESKLFISLEMLKGEKKIIADFKTTNNLNGTKPIVIPEDGTIEVIDLNPTLKDDEGKVTFTYDEDLEKYVSNGEVELNYLSSGSRYQLDAHISGSTFKPIKSVTTVPFSISVEDFILLEEGYIEEDGLEVWQGTIGVQFKTKDLKDNYGLFQMHGYETTVISEPGEELEYAMGLDQRPFDLIAVNEGNSAITDLVHKDGFFVDFTKLENDYIEIVIKSNFPITGPNQVTDMVLTDMMSVSKEHFLYHKSYHNIQQSQGNIFEENALYISNIDNGLGLFSSCVNSVATLEFRK